MKQMLMSQLAVQIRGVSYKPDDLHKGLDENSIALLRANNINDGEINFNDLVYVDRSKVSNNQLLRQGDILICASSGSKNLVGKAAQVDFNREITFGAFCKVVRPTTVESDYLGMYFQSPIYRKIVSSLAQGANINNIKNADIDNLLVNIPNNDTKKKIVEIFKRMQSIIRNRQQQLQKLDELVKARFVELFGSPCINSKGFQTQKGSSLFKISNGRAVPNDRRFETGIPAYGGNGISWYTDDILCKNDTIVIGRVGFQSGNVHLVKGPVWITDNAMYISELYDDNLSLVFLCAMMEHIDFTKQQDAGDLKKVTQKPFMETEYILPPKSLQEKYISFVEQVDKSKLSPYRDCWTRCNFCLAVWCDNTSNKEDIMEWLMNLDPSIWAALIGAVGAIIVALIKVIIPLFKKKEKASDKVAPSINQTVTGNGNTVIGIQNNMKGEKDGQ